MESNCSPSCLHSNCFYLGLPFTLLTFLSVSSRKRGPIGSWRNSFQNWQGGLGQSSTNGRWEQKLWCAILTALRLKQRAYSNNWSVYYYVLVSVLLSQIPHLISGQHWELSRASGLPKVGLVFFETASVSSSLQYWLLPSLPFYSVDPKSTHCKIPARYSPSQSLFPGIPILQQHHWDTWWNVNMNSFDNRTVSMLNFLSFDHILSLYKIMSLFLGNTLK